MTDFQLLLGTRTTANLQLTSLEIKLSSSFVTAAVLDGILLLSRDSDADERWINQISSDITTLWTPMTSASISVFLWRLSSLKMTIRLRFKIHYTWGPGVLLKYRSYGLLSVRCDLYGSKLTGNPLQLVYLFWDWFPGSFWSFRKSCLCSMSQEWVTDKSWNCNGKPDRVVQQERGTTVADSRMYSNPPASLQNAGRHSLYRQVGCHH